MQLVLSVADLSSVHLWILCYNVNIVVNELVWFVQCHILTDF